MTLKIFLPRFPAVICHFTKGNPHKPKNENCFFLFLKLIISEEIIPERKFYHQQLNELKKTLCSLPHAFELAHISKLTEENRLIEYEIDACKQAITYVEDPYQKMNFKKVNYFLSNFQNYYKLISTNCSFLILKFWKYFLPKIHLATKRI